MPFRFCVAFVLCALPSFAGEFAVLSTGYQLRIDRHETKGGTVLLYAGQAVTELPAASVETFETFLDPVPQEPARTSVPAVPSLPAPKPVPSTQELLRDAATQSGLPVAFVESVARVESGFRNDAVSPKGALGMMQLMPDTAKRLAADPTDPVQNTQAGARLLRELLIRYNGDVPKALAAYNAGTDAVDRYHGIPQYAETQNYVNQVIRGYIKAGGK